MNWILDTRHWKILADSKLECAGRLEAFRLPAFSIFAGHKSFSLADDKQQFVLMKANSRGKQCKSVFVYIPHDVIISWFSTFLTSTCYVQLRRFRCICETSTKREFSLLCLFVRGFSGGTLFLWSVWKNNLFEAHIATQKAISLCTRCTWGVESQTNVRFRMCAREIAGSVRKLRKMKPWRLNDDWIRYFLFQFHILHVVIVMSFICFPSLYTKVWIKGKRNLRFWLEFSFSSGLRFLGNERDVFGLKLSVKKTVPDS